MSRESLRSVGSDPDYRFSLANERTFLAWIRTSLALLAGGVAVLTVLPDIEPRWLRPAVGLMLLALSLLVSTISYRRWWLSERALRTGSPLPSPLLLRVVSLGIVALVAVVALAVFLR